MASFATDDGFGLALTGGEDEDANDDGGSSVFAAAAAQRVAPGDATREQGNAWPKGNEETLIELPVDDPQPSASNFRIEAGGPKTHIRARKPYGKTNAHHVATGQPPQGFARSHTTPFNSGTFPGGAAAAPSRQGPRQNGARHGKASVFVWLVARWCAGWVLAYRFVNAIFLAFISRPLSRAKTAIVARVFGDDASAVGKAVAFARRNKKQLTGAVYCSSLSVLFFAAVFFLTADFSVTAEDLRANGGRKDVVSWATSRTSNFTRKSGAFTCGEVRDEVVLRGPGDGQGGGQDPYNDALQCSFVFAMRQAEKAIDPNGPLQAPCACAPMFGLRRRHVAVMMSDKNTPIHMYNARLSKPPPSATRQGHEEPLFSRVLEHQRMLFPEEPESVFNVRQDVVWVEFLRRHQEHADTAASCLEGRVRLSGKEARCAQACFDLFEGISVYEKHKRAARTRANV